MVQKLNKNKINIINILEIKFNNVSFEEAIETIIDAIESNKKIAIFTPYSEIIMLSEKSGQYKKIINSADLILPDGISLIFASILLCTPFRERITGIDLTKKIINLSAAKGYKIFFLGSSERVHNKLSKTLKEKYPSLKFKTMAPPYKVEFDENDNNNMVDAINNYNPHILVVALGPPKQEKWIYNNIKQLKINVAIGAGGTVDFLAGEKKRAPIILQKIGLEWLFRLLIEPKRIKRQLTLPCYIIKLILWIIKKNLN